MDYRYKKDANSDFIHNRLYHVNDSASSGLETDDIDDQGAFVSSVLTINTVNNYGYDQIGNLTRDSTEEIDTITWTVYGKIKEIIRTGGSAKNNLTFDYDASGNRIAKHVLDASNTWISTTYYIRDAQGNVMSTYKQTVEDAAMTFKLKEQHLYGNSRIGMGLPELEMIGATIDTVNYEHILGKKVFEGTNHLSNILATFTDRKIAVDTNSDLAIDIRLSEVLSSADYSCFGVKLYNRGFENSSYLFSFNGKLDDPETGTQDYGMRIYNPSLGKFLSVDPITKEYPELTPYQFASNTPIAAADLDGLEADLKFEMGNSHQLIGRNGVDKKVYNDAFDLFSGSGGASVGMASALGFGAVYSLYKLVGNKPSPPEPGTPSNNPRTPSTKPKTTKVDANQVKPENQIKPEQNSNTSPKGRNSNKLEPNKEAEADHTTFARDKNGNIYKYEQYKQVKNPEGKTFWDKIKRFDGGKSNGTPGAPHNGIPTPHTQPKGGPTYPSKPIELPSNSRFNPF